MKGYRNLLILEKSEHNTYYIKVKHIQYISNSIHITHFFGCNYGYFLSFCLILDLRKSIAGFPCTQENLENLEYEEINFQAWKILGSGK